ncbi:MAG TPA: adenylate cyclase regulatory domain-containing protein [Solirubrobacteraceae bacterium]|nr:adenylate cyclase regulatory domain-containing protein [Solirubrobacteraceae bacterium]
MDFAAAGLLDGLEGEERKARERLCEQLVADGVSLEELTAAVAENRLALLPVDRVLGGRYSAREIEQRTGVPADLLMRYRRLLGLPAPEPDDPVFGDEDVEAARSTKMFLDAGFDENAIAEITRVLGEGISRLAMTATAAFAETFLQPGETEQDVATRFASLAERLTPAVAPILVSAFNQHLRESVRRGMLGRAELEAGQVPDAIEIAVCFADLVGFTRLGGEVEAQELGSLAGQFAQLAGDVVIAPVRLVKTIGDAAMFVSPEPAPLVAVALALVEAAEAQELPALRAGIAWGPALLRSGDYYGQPVNLASRVTGIARPESVLCTQEVHDAAPDEFEWSFAGRHRLKGITGPLPLFRARRRTEAEPPAEPTTSRADRPRTQGSR